MNLNKRVDSLITETPKIPGSIAINKRDNNELPLIKPEIKLGISNEILWEKPILFDEIETPEIPASLLPASLSKFAAALALTSETPESLSVMTILGVIASIISRSYIVSPKEGWQESTNIYCIIGLPPANNKTLVLRSCVKPLSDWEKEQRGIMEPHIIKQRSEYAIVRVHDLKHTFGRRLRAAG